MLVRYTVPGKYDEGDFGQTMQVMGDNDTFQIYIQVQDDPQEPPHWIKSGDFFERVFNHTLQDKVALDEYLKLYLYLIK